MARFNYIALDTRGQEATGLVEAPSSNAAISQLRQAGYFPTSVIEEAIRGADGQQARDRAAKMRAREPAREKGHALSTQEGRQKSRYPTRQLQATDSGLLLLKLERLGNRA
jgi:type IV pilus assembly protein PilC